MQLKKKTRIGGALATATCALLGSPVIHAGNNDAGWKVDTALLSYQEKDRVNALEGAVKAQKYFSGDRILNLNFVLDALTGASPNGAAPSDQPQTFTRPSGNGSYVTPAGEIPLDDTFRDTRVQLGASWDAPINRLMRYNVGFNLSHEFDYDSFAVSGGLSHDFNKKNTTLSLGGAFAFDTLTPKGGIPTPFAEMKPAGETQNRDGDSDTKQTIDLVLGLTQVISARTLMQFNVGLSQASGYLNDPFKIVSLVDDVNGRPTSYIYESRPDSRIKTSLYWNTKHHLVWGDTLDLSYRYMTDDWQIDSHTVDFRYRWNISNNWYLQPHVRWYHQSAAEFYRHSLVNTASPEYVSADYRLAEFDAYTLGAKAGYAINRSSEVNLRFESYQQKGDTHPDDAIGVQKNYDMFPDLDAIIVQLGYRIKF